LLEIDDVNVVPGSKNEFFHFRIPIPGLVTKMCTCL